MINSNQKAMLKLILKAPIPTMWKPSTLAALDAELCRRRDALKAVNLQLQKRVEHFLANLLSYVLFY